MYVFHNVWNCVHFVHLKTNTEWASDTVVQKKAIYYNISQPTSTRGPFFQKSKGSKSPLDRLSYADVTRCPSIISQTENATKTWHESMDHVRVQWNMVHRGRGPRSWIRGSFEMDLLGWQMHIDALEWLGKWYIQGHTLLEVLRLGTNWHRFAVGRQVRPGCWNWYDQEEQEQEKYNIAISPSWLD